MKKVLLLIVCCIVSVLQLSAQSQVKVLYDTYGTKYYESMNAANPPSGEWYAKDYDDSSWKDYTGAIDFPEYDAFWLRDQFYLDDDPSGHTYTLQLAFDDNCLVYVNGNNVLGIGGAQRYGYHTIESSNFVQGVNTLAIYDHDTGGDQYLEYNIYDETGKSIQGLPNKPTMTISTTKLDLYLVDNTSYNQKQIVSNILTPTGAANVDFTWESSNSGVATVENGLVKAVAAGTATITATTTYGGTVYTKTCEVTVSAISADTKAVFVETAGTLNTLITEEEKENIENLTVFGSLNGTDIKFLREMAGSDVNGYATGGVLSYLDLSSAKIVSGGDAYMESSNYGTQYTENNIIGYYMFNKCKALVEVTLPETTTAIYQYAFQECSNLRKVNLNEGLQSFGYGSFRDCQKLQSVEIPASVTSMEGFVFYGCKKLSQVTFAPNNKLTNIGYESFEGTALKSIIIPASVTNIGSWAFGYCTSLTSVSFEEGSQLAKIEEYVFQGCNGLTTIDLPQSVAELGNYTFQSCSNLKTVNIPEDSKLAAIGENTFNGCPLTSFYIPRYLTAIENIGLNASTIQSITIHPNNKYLEIINGVVYGKKSGNIDYVPQNISGTLTIPTYTTDIPENCFNGRTGITTVVLSTGVTNIADNAFYGCSGITTMISLATTPPDLTTNALNGLAKDNITLVVPEASVDAYKATDWKNFTNISTIGNEPKILLSNESCTLYNVSGHSTKQLSATVFTGAGMSDATVTWSSSDATVATVDANGLVTMVGGGTAVITASVTINEVTGTAQCRVNAVGEGDGKFVIVDTAGTLSTLIAEDEMLDITKLTVVGTLNSEDIRVIRYMAGRDENGTITAGQLQELDMSGAQIVSGGEGYLYSNNYWRGTSDNYISDYMFYNCGSLKKVTLPSTITNIGYYAFDGCSKLETVVLPSGLTRIGHRAFAECKKLKDINLPSSLTSLDSWIFYDCKNLESIDLSTLVNIKSIPSYTFSCSGLKSITIPSNITNIESNAFENCKLNSIEFSDNCVLSTISSSAFYNNDSLTVVDFPTSLKSIGTDAFYSCDSLKTVNFAENGKLSAIGDDVFVATAIKYLYIPRSVMSIGNIGLALDSIVVDPRNNAYQTYGNTLISTLENKLIYVPYNMNSVRVMEGVTEIGDRIFTNHNNLELIILPKSLTNFGAYQLCENSNLKYVYCQNPVPPTASELTNNIWSNIMVYVPNGAIDAYREAGWGENGLTLEEKTLKPGITLNTNSIALIHAHGASEQEIGYSVLGDTGFVNDADVTWTSSNESVVTITKDAIVHFAGEGSANIYASVTIGQTVYKDTCKVTTTGTADPENTYYLTGNNNLRTFFTDENKYDVTKLVLLGYMSDDDANFIREIASSHSNESGNTVEGKLAYLDMSALDNTNMQGFSNTSLEIIKMPNKVSTVTPLVLSECKKLTTVVMPSGLTYLYHQIFDGSSNIKAVIFPGTTVPTISDNSFYTLSQDNFYVIVPEEVKDSYMSANNWQNLTNVHGTGELPLCAISDKSASIYNTTEEGFNNKQLTVTTITKDGVANPTLTWNSSNESVAVVDANGLVKAGIADGEATITATSYVDGKSLTAECKITNTTMEDGRFINVETAGTLSSLITDEEKESIKRLVISGNLNNDDVKVLRYMAGRNEYGGATTGVLELLDMSKANMVSGGTSNGYFYKDGGWRGQSDNQIGYQAFYQCNSLKKIILPNSVTSIEYEAFYNCNNLETIVLSDNLTYMSSHIFSNCAKLKEISIPSGITRLEWGEFDGCTSLTTIDFSKCTNLEYISSSCFSNTGLKTITIPASVTSIESSAFQSSQLEEVTFEEGSLLTTMGSWMFGYCHNLKSINIPDNVEAIDGYVFYDDSQLQEVNFTPESKLSSIGEQAFYNCALKSFYIPAHLTDLSNINFPSSLESISVHGQNKNYKGYQGALYDVKNDLILVPNGMTTLILSESTDSIADGALTGCGRLRTLFSYVQTPPTCITSAFDNLSKDAVTVYVPQGTKTTYEGTVWNAFRHIVEIGDEPMISLNNTSVKFFNVKGADAGIQLTATILTPKGIVDTKINWASADQNIATVDANGLVNMGTTTGETTITATATVDEKVLSAVCNVKTTHVADMANAYFVSAGNLSELIPESEKANITSLTLFGTLNGTDLNYLREMAGIRHYYWDSSDVVLGKLEYLDMSNARIVSGGNSYGYEDYYYSGTNMSSMDMYSEDDVIGNGLFRRSKTLKTILIPESTIKIGTYAFYECANIDGTFELPESVTSLEGQALVGFEKVTTTATTPATLNVGTLISDDAVVVVPSAALTTYRTADNWKLFSSRIIPDNVATTANFKVTAQDASSGLLAAAGGGDAGDTALSCIMDLTLSGTINSYDIYMIRNRMPLLHNLDLTNVKIVANPYEYYENSHSEANRFGQNAFRGMNQLRSVVLPNSIDYVGDCAFYDCNNLRSVKMYEGVNTIDNNVFWSCDKLTNVELPEGLLSIGSSTFYGCYALETITLPSTICSMGSNAFSDCYNLKSIVLPRDLTQIPWSTFSYCQSLESVVIGSKVNTIDGYAFYCCSKLKELRIPPMVEKIGEHAFRECSSLYSVYNYIANPEDIKIDQETFSTWGSATLFIPAFSYNSYYWDTQWGQFYKKEEFDATYDEFYTKNTLALNKETGKIEGTPDATIYENGGLTVSDDVEQDLTNIDVHSDGTNAGSIIPESENNIKAQKLTITIKVKANNWHFFSFPFDIALDKIKYDGDYVWRRYDGAARSRREGGWQDLDDDATKLEKGRGYIFQGTTESDLVMEVDNPDIPASDVNVDLEEHESDNASDAGWNFMGNPYTAYYDINETSYSAPITIWNGTGYESYRPGDDDYAFAPYQAFFVQSQDDGQGVGFESEGRESYNESKDTQAKAKALRAMAKTSPNRLFINLELTAEGDSICTDKTRIVFNDKKELTYEKSCDAGKFFSSSRSAEMYTIDSKSVKYSINERPVAEGTVRLGYVANTAGTYSIAAVRTDCDVVLVDNVLGATHDLSLGEYTFETDKGTFNNRFTIQKKSDPTSIDVIAAKTGIVISTENGIDISNVADDVDISVYNTGGACVASQTGAGRINVPSGVYIMNIGSMTAKIVVK